MSLMSRLKLERKDIFLFVYIMSVFGLFGKLRVYVEIFSIGCLCVLLLLDGNFVIKKDAIKVYSLWYWLFMSICVLTFIMSSAKSLALYGMRGITECFICGIALMIYIRGSEDVERCLKFSAVSTVLLLFVVLLFVPFSQIQDRTFGEFVNANSFGMSASFGAIILSWFILNKRPPKWQVIGIITMLILLFVAVVLSGSRKGLLLASFGSVAVFILSIKEAKKRIIFTALAVAALVVLYFVLINIPFLYQSIGRRAQSFIRFLFGGRGDGSIYERQHLIKLGIEFWKKKPLLGYGINTFGAIIAFSSHGSVNMYSHNNYVELLFGVGVVGLAAYYSLFVFLVFQTSKKMFKDAFAALSMVLLVSILLLDFGMVSYGDEKTQYLLALITSQAAVAIGGGRVRSFAHRIFRRKGKA